MHSVLNNLRDYIVLYQGFQGQQALRKSKSLRFSRIQMTVDFFDCSAGLVPVGEPRRVQNTPINKSQSTNIFD